jgi:hypothetical protein
MNNHTQTALYALVDALDVPVTMDKTGKTGAGEFRVKVDCGPIRMKFPVRVKTDVLKDGEAAVLVHFRGHLWGYAYAHFAGDASSLWLALFNGDSLDFKDFACGEVKKTSEKIRKLIVGTYQFKKNQWTMMAPKDPT